MNDITNKTKTILFAVLAVAAITPYVIMEVSGTTADSVKDTIDQIGEQTILLIIENQQLQESTDSASLEKIADNNQRIAELQDKMREAIPQVQSVGISDELMKDMKHLQIQLRGSELPIYLTGPNTETGEFDIYIDSTTSISGMSEKIQSIASNVPVNIIYEENKGSLQAACDSNGTFCNPIVGGADGKDKYYGQPCTVSLGVKKGSTNGILIPAHCDRNNSDYYQSNTGTSSHKVGKVQAEGWWYCDCEFVKSDSRTVSQTKITLGSSDYTISGKSDFSKNDIVFLYGQTSGWDWGIVTSVGNDWTPYRGGPTYSDLYKIKYISFDDGDSGAPAIDYYDGNYGGMNIGSAGTNMQMVHEWSHMKWNLGLN